MSPFITNYLKAVGTIFSEQIFRGQADSSWTLLPSLARQREHFSDGHWTFNSWKEAESVLLEQFRRYSPPFLDTTPETDLEWLVLAQHFGLPTVLLDWTTNPLMALFFAVENPTYDDKDAAVYSYMPEHWYGSDNATITVNGPTCFFPKHQNARLTNQEGCFLIFPLPDGYNDFPALEFTRDSTRPELKFPRQITIPSAFKQPIRAQLDMLGINHRTAFPGLDGVSRNICIRAGIP